MGKAQITANLGEGLYQARITYNTTLPAARKAALEARVPALEQKITDATTARQAAETNVTQAQVVLNQLIEQLVAATPEAAPAIRDSITEKTTAARPLADTLTAARLKEASLSLELAEITTEITRLEALLAVDDTRNIWCADYSTTLSGLVDTIEINGEPAQILIAPNGSGEPAALLTSVEAMTPAGWARNFALAPYWQKYKPTYRTGLILALSEDTATVALDAGISSYQDLPINQGQILGGVPIQYRDCNGAAFEAGDAVVVRFTGQNWSSPVVVGFENNPEICCPDTISIQYTTINMYVSESQELSVAEEIKSFCPPVYWSISEYPQPADWANPSPAELLAATTGDGTRGHLTNLDGSPLTDHAVAVLYTAPAEWISCAASHATVQIHSGDQVAAAAVTINASGHSGAALVFGPDIGTWVTWWPNWYLSEAYCFVMEGVRYYYKFDCGTGGLETGSCGELNWSYDSWYGGATEENCLARGTPSPQPYTGLGGCKYISLSGTKPYPNNLYLGSCCWDPE